MPQKALLPDSWQFEPQAERDLLARLRTKGKPLSAWCGERFYYGIKTGLNDAFVIDGNKRAELIAADSKSTEIIKPFLRGRDVKRWRVEPADKWLIFVPWHFPLHGDASVRGASKQAEEQFAKQYPAIFAHLLRYKSALERRNASETGIRYEWYALQRWGAAYWHEFDQPKIVVPAIEKGVAYAPDESGYYSNDKTSIIVTHRTLFLLAILNSSVSWWITRQDFASRQGGFYEFKPMYVGKLPIPHATAEQDALITTAVATILAGAAERKRFEALINAFVYELFFPEDLAAAALSPFAAARDAGLHALTELRGSALARAADTWSRHLADPASSLYATLTGLQAIDVVRIIEGR
jgi:adenine-specific DNA-methyltransferase